MGQRIQELSLYEIWSKKDLPDNLMTVGSQKVEILSPGDRNPEIAGPDFQNARIRIDNFTYVGDIEIDNDISDWRNHGHYLDSKYNKVVLHVTVFNKDRLSFVYTNSGRRIPTVCLSDFISFEELTDNSQREEKPENNFHILSCANSCKSVENNLKSSYLFDLGILRFQKKCDKMFLRLKELAVFREKGIKEPVLRYDLNPEFLNKSFTYNDFTEKSLWQQLFYEYMFESLGYTQNKMMMTKLARAATIEFLKSVSCNDMSLLTIQACLFHIAGLLPEENIKQGQRISPYVKQLEEIWNSKKIHYDGKIFNRAQWNFFRMRPLNFPTIRISGGSVILSKVIFENLLSGIMKNFKILSSSTELIREMRKIFKVEGEGFWKDHYLFEKPAKSQIHFLIGIGKVDDIIINNLLPFTAVYADIFGHQDISKKVLQCYNDYIQMEDNGIVLRMSETLGMGNAWKRSILSQGMLELFRNYCLKHKCAECTIGKAVCN